MRWLAAAVLAVGAALIVLGDPFGEARWLLVALGVALAAAGAAGARRGGLAVSGLAVAVALVASGAVLAADDVDRQRPRAGGWIVVDGDELEPPYDIEVVGLELRINGRVVRDRAREHSAPQEEPDGPVALAVQRIDEAGGPWPGDVPDGAMEAIVDELSAIAEVTWEPPFLVVDDAMVVAQRPAPASDDELVAALEEEADAWRALVAGGGGLLIDGGRSVELPPDEAVTYGDGQAIELISRGTQRTGRTPTSNEAYLFTPFTAEGGVCHVGPLKEAARLHHYRVTHYDGLASSEADLMATSGRAGILYICAHGGQGMRLYRTREEAQRAADELERRQGLAVPIRTIASSDVNWFVLPITRGTGARYDGSGTILWSDGCSTTGDDIRGFYRAREYIGTARSCYTGLVRPLHESFWGRMAGTIAGGSERAVKDAFDGMQSSIQGYVAEEKRLTDEWQADRQARMRRGEQAPPRPFTGWAHFGPGTSVLSPAVKNYSPDQTRVLPLGMNTVWVQFDAPVAPRQVGRLVRARGCGAVVRQAHLVSGGYIVVLQVEITQADTVTFEVDPLEARSQDAVELRLDGNGEPTGTDHVGPSGDAFTWKVDCVPAPARTTTTSTSTTSTTAAPTTPETVADRTTSSSASTTTTETTTTTTTVATTTTAATTTTTTTTRVADARRRLRVEARSFNAGALPADGITRDPDRADYADSERVVLEAPPSFSSGGFRHFFVQWEVSPRVDHAANGTTIAVAMTADVTVTAVYESAPESS